MNSLTYQLVREQMRSCQGQEGSAAEPLDVRDAGEGFLMRKWREGVGCVVTDAEISAQAAY